MVSNNIDVSVIVPVYNTEKYLPQCIDSLVNQSLRNVEFIFVDDGSTDCSVEIIEKYQREDNRIQLIKQQNQNAGAARNNGMKNAKGKYIIFLDSDDFFELNMLEESFKCAESNRAEIVVFGWYLFDSQNKKTQEIQFADLPSGCVSFQQIGEHFFSNYWYAPWNKLFLKSFIDENNLEFQPIRKCNDFYFTNMAAFLAKRVYFFNKRFVYYRTNNDNSLQGNIHRDRSAIIDAEAALKQDLKKRGLFYEVFKETFYNQLFEQIRRYGLFMGDKSNAEEYIMTLKNRMIPELFDSTDELYNDEWAKNVYNCNSFEEYLWYRVSCLEKEKKQIIDKCDYCEYKNNKDYLIGHFILIIPRRIKHLFKKFIC